MCENRDLSFNVKYTNPECSTVERSFIKSAHKATISITLMRLLWAGTLLRPVGDLLCLPKWCWGWWVRGRAKTRSLSISSASLPGTPQRERGRESEWVRERELNITFILHCLSACSQCQNCRINPVVKTWQFSLCSAHFSKCLEHCAARAHFKVE